MERLHGPENRAPLHYFPDGTGLGPAPADKHVVVLFYTRREAPKVSLSWARGTHAPVSGHSAPREECY